MMDIMKAPLDDLPRSLLFEADESFMVDRYPSAATGYMARLEGETAGEMVVHYDESQGEILNIAVADKFRRRGVATELLETALAEGKERGLEKMVVKTGATGYGQLALYQNVGFRILRIVQDYFIDHYPEPMVENGLLLQDQAVLEYPYYYEKEVKARIESFWKAFTTVHPSYAGKAYDTWSFGYGNAMANSLLALVLEGKKQATCSAVEVFSEDDVFPQVGSLSVVTFGNGLPACILETVELREKPYSEITEEEAAMEGEGDLSLEYWREGHRKFFTLEYEEAGKSFHEDIPVLWERFRVVWTVSSR